MECNKEEAIRAREIAERKMQGHDFVGARRIALKAQQLFPDLDNISQILTVCEVHCSAQNKLEGSEMDWYGILQLEKLADEVAIKKQYRKLALLLHPDKNKFAGAEAAFKIIGEANRVLSDSQKRHMYDLKCRAQVRTVVAPKPPQASKNTSVKKQRNDESIYFNVPNSQSQPGPQNGHGTFWTVCPFCQVRYQYYRNLINKNLRCHRCSKNYVAHDVGPQTVASGNLKQPISSQTNVSQGDSRSTTNDPPMTTEVKGSFTSIKVGEVPVTKARNGPGDKNKGKEPPAKNTSMKRQRKAQVKASEGVDSMSTDEAVKLKTKNNCSTESNGFVNSSKRSRGNGSSNGTEYKIKPTPRNGQASDDLDDFNSDVNQGGRDVNKKGRVSCEESIPKKKMEDEVGEDNNHNDVNSKVEENSKSDHNTTKSQDYEYPDSEFFDFDKDKADHCFKVDQVWALYDTIDGMPRFYARVKKVTSPGFKLRITWFEANPNDVAEIAWAEEGLPVACGKFNNGTTQYTDDRLMFSHKIHLEQGSGSGSRSYVIYPQKGETWALFKDWDIRWSSDPENHRKYKFELVEVISDFDQINGIEVAYLSKVKGFLSLFKKTSCKGVFSFQIPANELLRFSHQVPSFRMTGREREGVPENSFELDLVALPSDLDELYDPTNAKMKKMESRVNTPKKAHIERDVSKLRRSPREILKK